MELENQNWQTHEQSDFSISYVSMLHQFEKVYEHNDLNMASWKKFNKETFEEISFNRKNTDCHSYIFSDSRASLAKYAESNFYSRKMEVL